MKRGPPTANSSGAGTGLRRKAKEARDTATATSSSDNATKNVDDEAQPSTAVTVDALDSILSRKFQAFRQKIHRQPPSSSSAEPAAVARGAGGTEKWRQQPHNGQGSYEDDDFDDLVLDDKEGVGFRAAKRGADSKAARETVGLSGSKAFVGASAAAHRVLTAGLPKHSTSSSAAATTTGKHRGSSNFGGGNGKASGGSAKRKGRTAGDESSSENEGGRSAVIGKRKKS